MWKIKFNPAIYILLIALTSFQVNDWQDSKATGFQITGQHSFQTGQYDLNRRQATCLNDAVMKSMKRLNDTRLVHFMVGSIDAHLANACMLELMWQEQSPEEGNVFQ